MVPPAASKVSRISALREDSLVIAIIGAGPRGAGILERLLANIEEVLPGRRVRIEVVDPYPPGGGRVWRAEQSPLMLMNAMAENVSMFADETVACDGPIRRGPSLSEWAATEGALPELTGMSFAARADQGRYLSWVFDRVVADRPPNVEVALHADLAVRLTDGPGDRQRVWLRDGAEPIVADAVILAVGHPHSEPDDGERAMLDFAGRRGLAYLPCGYTADIDLSGFRPGADVICRGFGLAFIDLMVLLTEGRGGRYEKAAGALKYVPCGAEPVLYVGSRRGVPYRTKFTYRLPAPAAPLPRFFDAARVNAAFADRASLDFRADLWPLMAKEIGWGYYHQLFLAHPERVTTRLVEFSANYARLDWDSTEMCRLIKECVPDPADRLDLTSLDRPLDGLVFDDTGDLQNHIKAHIAADIRRRNDPRYSADHGAFLATLSVHGQLPDVLAAGRVSARSRVDDLAGWWQGFFEYYGSGPPDLRVRQLHALAEAGVVRFLGAGMWVTADEERGVFRAGSASIPHVVEATGLAEARLPRPDLRNSANALLRGLYETGAAAELVLTGDDGFSFKSGTLHISPEDFRIIDSAGRPHPHRWALGPYSSVRSFAAFGRPKANSLPFRQNDILARSVLRSLAWDTLQSVA